MCLVFYLLVVLICFELLGSVVCRLVMFWLVDYFASLFALGLV